MTEQEMEQERMLAWKRCSKRDLSPDLDAPGKTATPQQLERALLTYAPAVSAFERSVEAMGAALPPRAAFLLTDGSGLILQVAAAGSAFHVLAAGCSLAERDSGVNAVALALRLMEPAWTLPCHHYCAFLSGCACYALPERHAPDAGCLAFFTRQKAVSREANALLALLEHSMELERRLAYDRQPRDGPPAPLTPKQRYILVCMAKGMTEHAAAAGLRMSRDTLHYHKKRLFKRLQVSSGAAALAKALQMGLLELAEFCD